VCEVGERIADLEARLGKLRVLRDEADRLVPA
jgi:hypothetical protein